MSRFPVFSRWVIAACVVLASLTAGALWVQRQLRLSEFPGQCNAAANIQAWDELEQHAHTWLQTDAKAGIAWFWLGEAQRGQQKFEESFESFGHVPLRGPRGIDAATARLEIQFHVFHQPVEALRIADEILAVEPAHADARRNRIYFDELTMQRTQMLQEIPKIIDSGGDLPDHYLYLMNLEDLWLMDGQEILEKWVSKSPDSVLLRASLLVQQAKRARATTLTTPGPQSEAAYQAVLTQLAGQSLAVHQIPSVLEFLILRAVDQGQVEEVGRLLSQVSDESAQDPGFWRHRGWYAQQTGDVAEAERSYQEAIRLHPLGYQTRHAYAQLLRSQGRTAEAGKQQVLAARGTALVDEIRKLPHLKDAPHALLREIARLAGDCGAWSVSNGIHRHQNPNVR